MRGNSLSVNCPRTNYFGGNYRGGIFLGDDYPGGNYPGWNCPGGNYPGGSIILGDNCPGGAIVLGGNYPGEQLSGGAIVQFPFQTNMLCRNCDFLANASTNGTLIKSF